MKVKHLALAAALAFSTPALAAPAYENAGQSAANAAAANVLFGQWLSAWSTVFDANYGDNWDYDSTGSRNVVYGQIYQIVTSGTPFVQSFSWTNGSKFADYNLPAVAVPGPEAGAGLGALAMLGVAYWAKRRRSEQSLAA